MEIAGHVSPRMLKRYSHIRMAAQRRALAEINKPPAATPVTAEGARPAPLAAADNTALVQ